VRWRSRRTARFGVQHSRRTDALPSLSHVEVPAELWDHEQAGLHGQHYEWMHLWLQQALNLPLGAKLGDTPSLLVAVRHLGRLPMLPLATHALALVLLRQREHVVWSAQHQRSLITRSSGACALATQDERAYVHAGRGSKTSCRVLSAMKPQQPPMNSCAQHNASIVWCCHAWPLMWRPERSSASLEGVFRRVRGERISTVRCWVEVCHIGTECAAAERVEC